MKSGDAVQLLSEFAKLQGDLVRHFLNLYMPRDRERFRDVPDGGFVLDDKPWAHRRHGAGVSFEGPGGIHVNAHVAMADYPEAIDVGRLVEYLDSLGLDFVSFAGCQYVISLSDMEKMLGDMVESGVLREEVTHGSFPKKVFELICQ